MLFVTLFLVCFFLSAVNTQIQPLAHLVTIIFIFFETVRILIRKEKLVFPKGFLYLTTFLVITNISLIWSVRVENSVLFNLTFLEGAFFYFWAFNFGKNFGRKIHLTVLVPTFLYSVLILVSLFSNYDFHRFFSLFYQGYANGLHQHIGNLWVLTLIVIVFSYFKRKRILLILLMFLGIYFLQISFSRTVYLALGFSIIYLVSRLGKLKSVFVWTGVFVLAAGFIYVTSGKSLFLSRPYFLHSIQGFLEYPRGVGMGNFEFISKEFLTRGRGYMEFSKYTHNIFLEVLSGVGVFGLTFYMWFTVSLKEFLRSQNKGNLLPGTIFIAITISFLFDLSYTIPGITWLWFLYLGLNLSQQNEKRDFRHI